ncbi:MAG: RHS repeat-associated core domain-containing protein [Desulfuromonadales bacterium]|nr:RHS repeat-associated core domain-containing protein [Desulfuromonadales bacterium]
MRRFHSFARAPAVLAAVRTVHDGSRIDVQDTTRFLIDRWGAPTRITDPLGKQTVFTRGDPAVPALVTQVRYPSQRLVTLSWDARGNLREQRDSTAHLAYPLPTGWTKWRYLDPAALDSPSEIAAGPDSVVTRYRYHSVFGTPDTVHAPGGATTIFHYEVAGASRGLPGVVEEPGVPVFDPVTNVVSPQTRMTTLRYNALGNVEAVTGPRGGTDSLVYDIAQQVVERRDVLGHRSTTGYDGLGRPERSTVYIEGDVPLETVLYRTIDRVDSIHDPRGVTRRYRYDEAGRTVEETDEAGRTDYRGYDPAGNLVWSVPRHLAGTGDTIRMTYDVLGRLTQRTWPPRDRPHKEFPYESVTWGFAIEGGSETFVYHPDRGGLIEATTPHWRITRTLHANGLVRSEAQTDLSNQNTLTQQYGYDGAGRRTKHIIGSSPRDSVWYGYDPVTGSLAKIGVLWRTGRRDSVRFEYDALGRRTAQRFSGLSTDETWGEPLSVHFAYNADDALQRLCALHSSSAGAEDRFLFRMEHQVMDLAGRIHETLYRPTFTSADPVCAQSHVPGAADSVRNTYDVRGQLTRQVAADSAEYTYDHSGNRLTTRRWTYSGTPLQWDSLVYLPGRNRESARVHRYADTGDTHYEVWIHHTGEGHIYQEEIPPGYVDPAACKARFYWYDALGRFEGMSFYTICGEEMLENFLRESPDACRYDALGRSVRPCDDLDAAAITLFYDGANVVRTGGDADLDAWTFVHGPGTDAPLLGLFQGSQSSDTTHLFWVTDGAGRQYAAGEADGRPFDGAQIRHKGYRYAGAIRDPGTFANQRFSGPDQPDLSFFRNRHYDQRTGRWLQEDPLGLAAGTNLYSYVGNDPVSYIDPFGLQACDPPGSCAVQFAAAGGAIGATTGAVLASPGGPTILVGAGTGFVLGSAVGGLAGAVADNADQITSSIEHTVQSIKLPPRIRQLIEVIGGVIGIATGNPPPRRIEPERTREEQVIEGGEPPPPPPDETERKP